MTEPASTTGDVHARVVVLIAEDDDDQRALLAKLLRHHIGAEVLEARDGLDALKIALAARRRIDLLLTDLQMPRMDGFALMEAIRARLPDIPAVVMTTDPLEPVHRADGAEVPVLRKPFRVAELLDAVTCTVRIEPGGAP